LAWSTLKVTGKQMMIDNAPLANAPLTNELAARGKLGPVKTFTQEDV